MSNQIKISQEAKDCAIQEIHNFVEMNRPKGHHVQVLLNETVAKLRADIQNALDNCEHGPTCQRLREMFGEAQQPTPKTDEKE